MSRPSPPTRVHSFVAMLADLALAVLIVLAIPLVIGAPLVVVGWAISAIVRLF